LCKEKAEGEKLSLFQRKNKDNLSLFGRKKNLQDALSECETHCYPVAFAN
jgi:hypothetical protein